MMSQTSVKTGVQEGRFPSLSALKNANNELLKMRRESSYSSEFLNKIKEFVKLAQATGAVLNVDTERWAGQSLLDYWSNYLYRAGIKLDEHEDVLANFDPKLAPTIPDSLCPYVGLAAFREEAHDKFFGRQKLVEEMCKRLSERRFLAVLGPSGSGKSSLVMAGLVPALKAGAISADGDKPGSKEWRYCQRTVPGTDPLLNLAMLVRPATTSDPNWAKAQTQAFIKDAGHLLRLINEAGGTPAFILVDQFEEIFTLTSDEAVRTAFTNNLLKVVEFPDVRHTVVITMRSDFEEYITKIGKLQELYAASNIRVTPLSAAELREAIVQPAEPIGLKFEDGIVDQLVHEVLGEPGGLPLLQFTLRKLWDNRKQNLVTWDAFHEFVSCREALTRAADQVYNELSPPDQERAKRIFLKLVRPSTGVAVKADGIGSDTAEHQDPASTGAASTAGVEIIYTGVEVFNNRLPRAQLYIAGEVHTHIDQVLAKFLDAGLLRETETDMPGEAKIEVAHEALIRHWKTLNSWLIEARVNIGDRLRFADAAKLWDKRHRDSSALLTGELLEDAQKFEDLTPLEKTFIKRSSYRQRGIWIGLAVAAALAITISTFFAVRYYNQSERERIKREEALQVSTKRLAALTNSFRQLKRLDLALLLNLELSEIENNYESRSGLLQALDESSGLIAYLHEQDSPSVELAFDNQGNTLFAINQDGTVNSWNSQTHKPLSSSSKPISNTLSVALTPDHKQAAISVQDKGVRLIDVTTGQELRKFELNQDGDASPPPSRLIFSPSGQLLAGYVSAATNEIVLWDISTGRQRNKLIVDDLGFDEATCMAFSTDSKLLAVGIDSGDIRLWNLQSKSATKINKEANKSQTSPRGITSLAFSPPENKILAAGDDRNITFWDTKRNKSLGEIDPQTRGSVTSLAYSNDGKMLASGSADNSVALWDTSDDEPAFWGDSLGKLAGHSGSVLALAFNPDGTILASSDSDKKVILSDTKNTWRLATPLPISTPTARPTPRPTINETAIPRVSPVTMQPVRLLSSNIALSADGRTLASLTNANSLFVWDIPSRKLLRAEPIPGPNISLSPSQSITPFQLAMSRLALSDTIAFSSDNKTVAASRGTPRVGLWDINTGQSWLLPDAASSGNVTALSFNPTEANMLAIACENTANRNEPSFAINLWDTRDTGDNNLRHSLTGHQKRVTTMAFRSDGKVLATGSQDGFVILWEVDTGRQIQKLSTTGSQASENNNTSTSSKGIGSVAWSRDNKILACGDLDNTITLWDVTDVRNIRQIIQVPTQHDRGVVSLAFSPNNTTLASGGYDGTIYLWDVGTHSSIGSLKITDSIVKVKVAFGADDKTLVSNGGPYNVLLWDLSLETWKREACKIANRPLTKDEWQQFMGEDVTYHQTCP